MVARRKRRGRQNLKELLTGMGLIGGSLLVIGVAIISSLYTQEPERDENGCPITHRAPSAHTILLIDQTDSLPPAELTYARALILNEYHWLPINGKLTIRAISGVTDADVDLLSVCRVPTGGEANRITRTQASAERDFQQLAGRRLTDFLNIMETMPEATESPIFESVVSTFDRLDFTNEVETRRLVILSDLSQYTDSVSHYCCSATRFTLPDLLDENVVYDIDGVSIDFHYVRRPSLWFQGPAHQQLWSERFSTFGARVNIGHRLHMGMPPGETVWHEN